MNFRKKYTKEEAEKAIEKTVQIRSVYIECLFFLKTKPQNYKLISALCNQSVEEMIEEAEKKLEYVDKKLEYIWSFSPDYRLVGSYGFFSF